MSTSYKLTGYMTAVTLQSSKSKFAFSSAVSVVDTALRLVKDIPFCCVQ